MLEKLITEYADKQSDAVLSKIAQISPALRMLKNGRTEHSFVLSFTAGQRSVSGVAMAAAGENPVAAYEAYTAQEHAEAGVLATADAGCFAFGATMQAAIDAKDAYLAGKPVPPCSGSAGDKELSGKVMIITGGAQGFGAGIADYCAAKGATIVIADLNLQLAKKTADALCEKYGACAAIAITMDVTSEQSVERGIQETVAVLGGVDVFLSNAGVLRAGETATLSLEDFMFVTNVDYVGYFICVKKIIPVLALQHSINPDYWMDIIQTNSKSGLTGSNKNCSYAGSKFGSIGLTQSFAMELVDINVKVNSVCPGNYLTGPLWSDPVDGLFMQYLRTDKIKGAKTIEDLVRHYNGKVPMRRGCEPEDVAKAIVYIIGQDYETGQAVPVTGGQLMLK